MIESCDNEEETSKDIWKVKEIGHLFNEKLGSGSKDFSDLSLDGFLCIQSYFLLDNETDDRKVLRYNVKPAKKYTSFSSIGGASFGSFGFVTKKKEEEKVIQKFKVYVPPKELNGIENIWRIVIESNLKEVNGKAVDLIINLYKNLAGEIEEKQQEITEQGVEDAMSHIKRLHESNHPLKF